MAWLVLLLTLTFVGSSFVTPFAGFDPDAFPISQDNPPAQPAGYAFAIWGLIYLWLMASAVFGALRRRDDAGWARVRLPLSISLFVGTFWLAVASTSPIWAMVLIWVMLLTALWALAVSPQSDRWLLRAPLGLYAGWLAAASWVSVALNGAGFGVAFDAFTWAIVVVLAATALAAVILWRLRSIPEFGAAVIWALIAIALKSANGPTEVALIAGLSAAGVTLMTALLATSESV